MFVRLILKYYIFLCGEISGVMVYEEQLIIVVFPRE